MRYLYRKYYRMIEQLILKNNGSSEEAADIFQDGVVVLYRKVREPGFQKTAAFGTFLYAICRNLWLMRLRKRKRETNLTEVHQETIPLDEDLFDYLHANERSQWIANALSQLKDDCRRVLVYFYFDRLKMSEIQEKMQYQSEQVAKNKKSRCMKRLRELVKSMPEAQEYYD